MKRKPISVLKRMSKVKRTEYVNEIAEHSLINKDLELDRVSDGEVFYFSDDKIGYTLETEGIVAIIVFHDREIDRLIGCNIDEKIENRLLKMFEEFLKREGDFMGRGLGIFKYFNKPFSKIKV